jgi:hypothetical protein
MSVQERIRYAASSANIDLPKLKGKPLVVADAGCQSSLPLPE